MFDRIERKLALALGLTLALPGAALAQGVSGADAQAGSAIRDDCEARAVEYESEAQLTREERIARMDRALTRSLDRFAECQSDRAGAASGGGGDANGEGGSEGDGLGTGSVAAGDISGTEAPRGAAPVDAGTSAPAGDIAGDAPSARPSGTVAVRTDPNATWTPVPDETRSQSPGTANEPGAEAPATSGQDVARTDPNGRVPADIPPADNDSVLEAQIRKAAMEEDDPELREKLWDEYRRYKGLPLAE